LVHVTLSIASPEFREEQKSYSGDFVYFIAGSTAQKTPVPQNRSWT
jgi:hypothetical protein